MHDSNGTFAERTEECKVQDLELLIKRYSLWEQQSMKCETADIVILAVTQNAFEHCSSNPNEQSKNTQMTRQENKAEV
jgi:hypothetical protein